MKGSFVPAEVRSLSRTRHAEATETHAHVIAWRRRRSAISVRSGVTHATSHHATLIECQPAEIPRAGCQGNRHGMTLGRRNFTLPTAYFLRRNGTSRFRLHASYVVYVSTASFFATPPPSQSLEPNQFGAHNQVIVGHGSNRRYSSSPHQPAYFLRYEYLG